MSLTFAKKGKTILLRAKKIFEGRATICNTDTGYILMMNMEERHEHLLVGWCQCLLIHKVSLQILKSLD